MKERIEQILLKYQLSSAQFADIIGVQRSSISHIISGRNKPSFDFIEKILLKYPEINADWLITGRGNLDIQLNTPKPDLNIQNETDLFNQTPIKQEFKLKSTISNSEKNNAPIDESQSEINEKATEVTNVNYVKSIIFVYNDDSFKIINSR